MLSFFSRKSNPKAELQKVVGEYSLPTFPAVALKAMQLLRDDSRALSEVAKVVMTGPGLTTTILKTVNSASFGMRRPVRDVSHAATILGRSQVEALLVAAAVRAALPRKSPSINMEDFWRLATRRAAIARGFAQVLHPSTAANCYTASLLQDMAVPILAEAKSDYAPLLNTWQNTDEDLHDLERETFGWTHADIAGWLCQSWNFPDSLTGPIVTHHHDEEEADADMAPAAALLVAGLSSSPDSNQYERLVELARTRYNMDPDTCTEIVENGLEEGDQTALLFR